MTPYIQGFVTKLSEEIEAGMRVPEYKPTAMDVGKIPEKLSTPALLRPIDSTQIKQPVTPPVGSFNFGTGRNIFRVAPELSMGRYPGTRDIPGMEPIHKQDPETFKGFQGNVALNVAPTTGG